MYLTKDINIEDLSKVKIRKQSEIVQKIGEPLKPKAAFLLLKQESENFEKETDMLLKIDQRMAELFEREGILNPQETARQEAWQEDEIERERIRIRAMAELAELELLQLELELEQNNQ